MKLKHILSASILSLAFASCSNEMEEAIGGHGVPLQITANIEDTRAAGVEDKGFNKDEMIGLYVNNQILQVAYNGSGWDIPSEDVMLSDKEQTIYAYYNGGKKEASTRAIRNDKYDIVEAILVPLCNISAGTNCLISEPVKVSAANPVANLKFKHIMARVSFVVTRTNSDYINSMYISGDNIYTTAQCVFADGEIYTQKQGTVTVKEPPVGPVKLPTIIGSHANDKVQETIEALLIPAPAGEATITLDVNNKKYTATVSLPELKQGGYYRLPISLSELEPKGDNYENGHEYVDLGLPSGTLWATCNVDASSPDEYGGMYAWGEITEKNSYTWKTYKWCSGSQKSITKYGKDSQYGSYGILDNKTVIEPDDDVAHVKWGGKWRIPVKEEWEELISKDNCTLTWATMNGINGCKVSSNKNGNSVFLPAAGNFDDDSFINIGGYGRYTSASLANYSYTTYNMGFSNGGGVFTYNLYDFVYRSYGRSVRPVFSK